MLRCEFFGGVYETGQCVLACVAGYAPALYVSIVGLELDLLCVDCWANLFLITV